MFRSAQNLIRYAYGYNGGNYSRYQPKIHWETENVPIKQKFEKGEEPQYMLDAKIKFDK